MKEVKLHGLTIKGNISDHEERILKARDDFVIEYCKKNSWDINNLSFNQVFEIRSKPEWKDPLYEER